MSVTIANGLQHILGAHREGIDILVQLVEERDGLDNHVVNPVDVELHLGARVAVAQTKLRLLQVTLPQRRDKLREVQPDAAENKATSSPTLTNRPSALAKADRY